MTWLFAILALSLIIIIHEFGHYLAARMTGMHVATFSMLGIGRPILHLFKYKGTDFVISAIPFGAYVQIVGMEPEEFADELTEDERKEFDAKVEEAKAAGLENYRDRPAWARALVLAGGPLANYAAAIVLAFSVYASAGIDDSVAIAGFTPDSAAQAAGLKEGDVFQKIGDHEVKGDHPDYRVISAGGEHKGETVDVTVLRDGEELTVPVTLAAEGPALGTQMISHYSKVPVTEALGAAAVYPFAESARSLTMLGKLITGKIKGRVGGPVQIVSVIKQKSSYGFISFLMVSALISTALGLFNLLPVPALDGGRLVFIGIEVITRRKVPDNIEANVHGYGMMALLLFIAYVTIGDVRGLWRASQTPEEAPTEQVEKDDAAEKAEADAPADSAGEDKAAKVAGEATPASASAGG